MAVQRAETAGWPTLVVTRGLGSMDRYGQRLAAHLPVPAVTLDLDRTSAGRFNVPALGPAALGGLLGDAALLRTLRSRPGPLHLAHHHLARYGPLLGRPYLLTAHDLIRHADLQGRAVHISRPNLRDRLWLRRDYAGFARAAALIAVSEATKRDLVTRLHLPPERIRVVHEGLDHDLFRPVARRLVDGPYLLFVGSEHPRKNLPVLLRAFAALKRDPQFTRLRLVKVGAAGSTEARFRAPTLATLRALGLEREVVFPGEVPDADLPAYYAGAACFVLPSRAEGFGFPPLEAMACGCPAVVSTAGSLPEIAGPAALTVDPDDVAGLVAALRRVLTDDALRARLRLRGLARARDFSWERTAGQTLEVYEWARSLDGRSPLSSARSRSNSAR
jgi:glycosyltransferase involved in cell wall biosynthesis